MIAFRSYVPNLPAAATTAAGAATTAAGTTAGAPTTVAAATGTPASSVFGVGTTARSAGNVGIAVARLRLRHNESLAGLRLARRRVGTAVRSRSAHSES